MVADIAFCVFEKWGSIKEAEAIVLLDEIEVHLHPRWKMTIVERLRRCFPRLSFITTTHDPLCLRGLHKNEIMVLRRAAGGAIDTLTDIPDLDGYRADQLLPSPLFDLVTTRGREPRRIAPAMASCWKRSGVRPRRKPNTSNWRLSSMALGIDETVRARRSRRTHRRCQSRCRGAADHRRSLGGDPQATSPKALAPAGDVK